MRGAHLRSVVALAPVRFYTIGFFVVRFLNTISISVWRECTGWPQWAVKLDKTVWSVLNALSMHFSGKSSLDNVISLVAFLLIHEVLRVPLHQ